MDAKQFLEILHVAERLKNTIRHCTTAGKRGRAQLADFFDGFAAAR